MRSFTADTTRCDAGNGGSMWAATTGSLHRCAAFSDGRSTAQGRCRRSGSSSRTAFVVAACGAVTRPDASMYIRRARLIPVKDATCNDCGAVQNLYWEGPRGLVVRPKMAAVEGGHHDQHRLVRSVYRKRMGRSLPRLLRPRAA